MMRYRVKRNCILFYGSLNKASISLSVGQIWEYNDKLSYSQFHTLTRQNVTLEITNEDFERIFEPQESEG